MPPVKIKVAPLDTRAAWDAAMEASVDKLILHVHNADFAKPLLAVPTMFLRGCRSSPPR